MDRAWAYASVSSLAGCQYAVITGVRKCLLAMSPRIDHPWERQERFSGNGRASWSRWVSALSSCSVPGRWIGACVVPLVNPAFSQYKWSSVWSSGNQS